MNVEEAVSRYVSKLAVYERFTHKLHDLLKECLEVAGIRYTTEFRTKQEGSLRRKILKPEKGYSDPLNEITDLCAVRVITRRLSDVQRVVEIISREFAIDEEDSVYKGNELDVNEFGYTSIHLVVKLSEERGQLTEWKPFSDIKAEIQVRTQLQHAWAVISHTFDYKIGADMPKDQRLRRRLFRLSALFELADEELDGLVNDISENIKKYRVSIEQGNTLIELNVDSLRTYLETSTDFRYWVDEVERITGKAPALCADLSGSIRVAELCGFSSLDEVTRRIRQARGWGEKLLGDYYEGLVKETNFPRNKIAPTLDGICNLLLIAANADRFTPKILQRDFGYADSPILQLILNSKAAEPK